MGNLTKNNFTLILSACLLLVSACGGGGGGSDNTNKSSNNIPVAKNDTTQLKLFNTINIDVLDNDTDADGDSLSIEIISQPESGTVAIQGNQISYNASDKAGTFSFEYRVYDGKDYSQPAEVTVDVEAVVISLNGRIVPTLVGATVTANLSTSTKTASYHSTTAVNGQYSVDLEIDESSDLDGFVSLQATTTDGEKYFMSNVGSVEKLDSQKDGAGSVSYLAIPQLELSAFSTAIHAYMSLEDDNDSISDDAEMENLLEKAANYSLYKLATLISRLNSNQTDLPDGVSSMAELLSNKETLKTFVDNIKDADIQSSSVELYGQVSFLDTSENFSNGLTFQYEYSPSTLTGKAIPVALDKRVDGSAQISRLMVPSTAYDLYVGTLEIDQVFNWFITPEKTLKLTALSPSFDDSLIYSEPAYIEACNSNVLVYLTLNEVEYKRVYSGEHFDQYLVKYSGETLLGPRNNPSCPWIDSPDWSKIELFNVNKDHINWSEVLTSAQIAVSVGNSYDRWGSASPSLVDLNSDGSAFVKLNSRSGNWLYDESGNLNLTLDDNVSVTYGFLGTEGIASRYVARKIDADGKSHVLSGLLMQVDPSFSMDSLIGRFEVTEAPDQPSGYAFSFQENFLGQESTIYQDGIWERVGSPSYDIYYYNWTADSDNNGIHSKYLVKVNAPDDYSNYSAFGCAQDDSTCYLWKTRDFRFLGKDGDYYYVMMNAHNDYTFQGYPGQDLTYGYVGIYHKVDFILPPVE